MYTAKHNLGNAALCLLSVSLYSEVHFVLLIMQYIYISLNSTTFQREKSVETAKLSLTKYKTVLPNQNKH